MLGIVAIAALAAIARPLLFASLQPELAEAKGVSLRLLSVLFLAIVALAVAECVQIVGVLLVFALMVGPAAAAQCVTTRFWSGIALSVALALSEAWLGLVLGIHHRLADQFLDHRIERLRLSGRRADTRPTSVTEISYRVLSRRIECPTDQAETLRHSSAQVLHATPQAPHSAMFGNFSHSFWQATQISPTALAKAARWVELTAARVCRALQAATS